MKGIWHEMGMKRTLPTMGASNEDKHHATNRRDDLP